MLSKKFKAAKCKTSLKLAVARIKLLKNKRQIQLKQMKRDLAQLLESGQDQTARIRVEHVVREEKTIAAYDFLELYCELLVARLPIIDSKKDCPIDLKEPVASVVFASPRCADIPELLDVRKQFANKYGKEFIDAALELRTNCGVNHTIIEKLSARTPDGETKIKILTAIAQEYNVKWDPAELEQQNLKPREDLLNGPSKFVSASDMHLEPQNTRIRAPSIQKYDSATNFAENDFMRSSETSRPVAASVDAPASMLDTCTSDLSTSGSFPGAEPKHSSSKKTTPFNRQKWATEFKDATSAAQAAAESAEMASMAARAAAELSRHGRVTGGHQSESQASSYSGSRNYGSERSSYWNSNSEHVKEDSSENESMRSSYGLMTASQSKVREKPVHESASRSSENPVSSHAKRDPSEDNVTLNAHKKISAFSPESLIGARNNQNQQGKYHEIDDSIIEDSSTKQSDCHASTNSRINSFDGEIIDDEKLDDSSMKDFPEAEYFNQNHQDTKTGMDEALFKSHAGSIDNYYTWDTDVQSNTDAVGHHSFSNGEKSIEKDIQETASYDHSEIVFDESGFDFDAHLDLESYDKKHFHTTYPSEEAPLSSHHSSSMDTISSKHWKSESFSEHGSRIFNQSSETIAVTTAPSQYEQLTATFDESDGLDSENEGNIFKHIEVRSPTDSPDKKNASMKSLSSFSGHETTVAHYDKEDATKESIQNAKSHAPFDDSDSDGEPSKSGEGKFDAVDDAWKRHSKVDSVMLPPSRKRDASRETSFSSVVDDQHFMESSQIPLDGELLIKDKGNQPSLPARTEDSEYLYDLQIEGSNKLSFQKLRGGLRNKRSNEPLYLRGHLGSSSASSVEKKLDSISKNLTSAPLDEISTSDWAYDNELHGEKPNIKVSKEPSTNLKTIFDSDSDEADASSVHGIRGKGYRGVMLSRRTRESSAKSVSSGLKSGGDRSDVHNHANYLVEGSSRLSSRDALSFEQAGKSDAPMLEKPSVSYSDRKSVRSDAQLNDSYKQKRNLNLPQELGSDLDANPDYNIDESNVTESRQVIGSRNHRDDMSTPQNRKFVIKSEMDGPQKFSVKSELRINSDLDAGPNPYGAQQSVKSVQPDSSLKNPSKFSPPSEAPIHKESIDPSHGSLYSEQPLNSSSLISGNAENSDSLASGNSSVRTYSHVHPKLPDYDTLAAHLSSLRTARRSQ